MKAGWVGAFIGVNYLIYPPLFLSPPAFMAPRCCGVGESEMPLMSDSASRRAVEFLKKTQAKATREVKEQRKKKKRRPEWTG